MYFKYKKKFFFKIFLIFIALSALHYNFLVKINIYRLEIAYTIDKKKIINAINNTISTYPLNLFLYGYEGYFTNTMEHEIDKNLGTIIDFKDNSIVKIINTFNKSSKSLNYNRPESYFSINKTYIIEINDINNINKLREKLNYENIFLEKKFLNNILNVIDLDILKIKIRKNIALSDKKSELLKKYNTLKNVTNNNDDINIFLLEEIFMIKESIKILETSLNFDIGKKNFVDALNINFIDYTIIYTPKKVSHILILSIYIFLSFTLSIFVTLIRLGYENHKKYL